MQHLQKKRGEAVVMVNQNSGPNSATKGLIELARQPDIRPYRGKRPQIASSAYIDPAAVIIGDVVIGEDSSVWPCSGGDRKSVVWGERVGLGGGRSSKKK